MADRTHPRAFKKDDIIVPREKLSDWVTWGVNVYEILPDGTILAFPMGGGPQLRFPLDRQAIYDFVKVPKKLIDKPGWYESEFFAEWVEKSYKGWSTGRKWNGWGMPYFEFDEAMRYARDSGNTTYDPSQDSFVTILQEGEEPEVDGPTEIEVPGRGKVKVYPIGAGSWTWSERKPPANLQGRTRHG